jgi:hypothetical protein
MLPCHHGPPNYCNNLYTRKIFIAPSRLLCACPTADRADGIKLLNRWPIWCTFSQSERDAARNISAKFKSLWAKLKAWSKQLSNLRLLISNCNQVICFLDTTLEDRRGLFNPEANLTNAVKKQLHTWLHYKNLYWQKRFAVNMIKSGDEWTKFFPWQPFCIE